MTDRLTIYVPQQGSRLPHWIDIMYCNVDSIDLYSFSAKQQKSTYREEERTVELQISLFDFNATGYLFLASLQPSNLPDKITLIVKDTQSKQYADAIEKARNIARKKGRIPVGLPLLDLLLPSHSKESRTFERESLQQRKIVISSLADSPLIDRIGMVEGEGRAEVTSILKTDDGGMEHSSAIISNTDLPHVLTTYPLDLCPEISVIPTLGTYREGKLRTALPMVPTGRN